MKSWIYLVLSLFLYTSVLAQNASVPGKARAGSSDSIQKSGRDFREVQLLSTYDSVLEKLKKDPLILVKPESDFLALEVDPPTWIVASLPPLMHHIYYHFFDGKLYVISLFFNPKKASYGELYQNLKENYGMPTVMDSQEARWELPNNTWVVLDPSPSVKYIDSGIFDILKSQDSNKTTLQSLEEQEKAFEAKILSDL